MFRSNPTLSIAVHRDEPPWDKKNNGMPVIGMTPITIPTLTAK